MRRRLTARTLAVSALIVGVVAVVLGGLAIAIDRQHEAGERARHSQAVIAAANLTEQRVLGGPDADPRLPDPRQRRPARGLPRRRAPRCPAAALELLVLVESDPGQRRVGRAGPQRVARVRRRLRRIPSSRARARRASRAGRAFARANDGSARAEALAGLIGRLGATEQIALARGSPPTPTPPRARAYWVAGIGFALCFVVLALARPRSSRAGS